MRHLTGLFACAALFTAAFGSPVLSLPDDDTSPTEEELPEKHDSQPWEFPIEEVLSRARFSPNNGLSVVTELRQLYGELQERLPQAHATRRVGLDISVEVNVEEASQAAIVLEDIVGHQAGADAGFMLAVLSATGIAAPDVSLNDTRAVQLLHTSARGGSEEAELALAHRYYFGDGVPKSCPEGIRRARAIADTYVLRTEEVNSPEVPLEPVSLRMRHRHGSYDDSSSHDAWLHLQMQADMYNLGDAYQRLMGYRELLGQDLEANPGEAMRNFEVAAGQGDAFAAFNLGYMYLKGVGTAPNFTAAEHHFKEAASQGVGSAYNGLGVLHFGGQTERGVDYAAARRAFQKGVALGDSDSMFNLAIIYGGGYGVDKNHSLAYGYYLDAHDVGHWRAPYALAVAHQAGLGVTPNCSRAWHYLQIFIKERSSWTDQNEMAMLAVDAGNEWEGMLRYAVAGTQGSAIAQLNLAWLLQHGQVYQGADKLQVCQRALLQAAQGGLPEAWVDAGDLAYWHSSLAEALRLYKLSAEAGESEGLYSLAWMHATAAGLPRNISQAVSLYRQAVQQAPDWQHAAPPFLALLLLPSMLALQWFQAAFGADIITRLVLKASWDTWALTAAAVTLTGVIWRRHQRSLQTQHHLRNIRDTRDTGVG